MDEKRKVTQEELDNVCILHNKYIEGEDDGKQAIFENCSFERLSFNNKQFNGAVFRNCDFKLCDLSDTGMCFAEIHNVRFNSCNCYMLTAEEAAFRDVTFDKCDLRSAVFTHSSLRNIAFDKCDTEKMSMQNCYELPEAEIIKITAEDLRKMSDKEGLILQGCGGDLQEWADGINSTLADTDILRSPFERLTRRIMMNTENNKNKIMKKLTAFPKGEYTKAEYKSELQMLLQQGCGLVSEFSEENIPPLWEIKSELRRRNDECGNVADEQIRIFEDNLDEVYNLYKAENSGNSGEQKVFDELDHLNCQNYVLHNVELEFDGKRCEIDAVVITNYGIFPIEIKNSNKNIHIDKMGYIFRNGTCHSKCDGNIVRKMDLREAFLRKALERAGMENVKIFKIVAITNTHIEFTNEAHRCLKVLYSNQLTHFIENFRHKSWHDYEDICTMVAAINEVRCSEPYKMKVDMNDFKESLVDLLVKLEEAESEGEEIISIPKSAETNNTVQDAQKNVRRKRIVRSIGKRTMQVAAFAGIMLFNVALLTDGKFLKR